MRKVYAKWVKEALDMYYNIYPVSCMDNPKDPRYKIWLYNKTEELEFALYSILEGKKNGK